MSEIAGAVGQVLADRYRLVALIGKGGMGSVWRAEHLSLGTPVAIKLIHSDLAAKPGIVKRFLHEARAAALLRGTNVVQIFDHGVHEGAPYIAMEHLEGESLHARLDRQKKLDPASTALVLTGVVRALARAHVAGIVHRDLKPDNIFLTRDEGGAVVKVLDFGIAKMLEPVAADAPTVPVNHDAATDRMAPGAVPTERGVVLGTPSYMSPEQLRSRKELDGRSDLWALAVIAFECLTGERPFDGTAVGDLVLQVCVEPIPVPSWIGEVPAGFDAWFERATQRDPNARFQTVREFSDALAKVLTPGQRWLEASDHDPESAPKPTSSQPGLRIAEPSPFESAPTVMHDSLTTLKPRPRRWLGGSVLAIGAVAVLASAALAFRVQRDAASPAASASAALPRSALVPGYKYVTPPKTTSEEAAREFTLGARANHDGDVGGAITHLRRAIAADPNLAVAHLWLAINVRGASPDEARREFATAWALRDQFTEWDRALARMSEAMLVPDPPDLAVWRERSEQGLKAWPDDTIFSNNLAMAELQTGHLDRSEAVFEHSLELDPEFRIAMANLASVRIFTGRYEQALALLDRCLELDRSTMHCLSRRLIIRDQQGACAAYEADARQLSLAAPNDRAAAASLANALAATGQPEAAVHQALERAWEVAPEADRAAISARDRAALAVLRGDLEAALVELDAARDWPMTAALPQRFTLVTRLRFGVLRELGLVGMAGGEARSIAERLPALRGRLNSAPLSMAHDPTPLLLDVELEGGSIDASGHAQGLRAWVDEWTRLLGPANWQRAHLWVYGYAEPARSESDAKEARAALANFGAVPAFVPTTAGRAGVGRTYLLAGDAAMALPWLEGAAHSCTPIDDPVAWVRAHFDLGRAREAKGDTLGACEGYRFVAERWGGAKSKSVTGQAAQARVEALHCSPPKAR